MTGVRIAHLLNTEVTERTVTLSRVLIFNSLISTCFPFIYFILNGDAALLWQIKPGIAKYEQPLAPRAKL